MTMASDSIKFCPKCLCLIDADNPLVEYYGDLMCCECMCEHGNQDALDNSCCS